MPRGRPEIKIAERERGVRTPCLYSGTASTTGSTPFPRSLASRRPPVRRLIGPPTATDRTTRHRIATLPCALRVAEPDANPPGRAVALPRYEGGLPAVATIPSRRVRCRI